MLFSDAVCNEAGSDREEYLADLAVNYAEYMKVDLKNEKKAFEETADELLTKLEEFLSLVDLIRSDNTLCLSVTLPRIYEKIAKLERIFQNIDKLEAFIGVVTQNVEDLDTRLTIAEKELLPENSLSRLFKPLFSRKETIPKTPERAEAYTPLNIFKTAEYLSPTSEDSGSSIADSKSPE